MFQPAPLRMGDGPDHHEEDAGAEHIEELVLTNRLPEGLGSAGNGGPATGFVLSPPLEADNRRRARGHVHPSLGEAYVRPE